MTRLTEYHKKAIMPHLIRVLKSTSPKEPLKGKKIIEIMNDLKQKGSFDIKFTGSLLRRLTNHIRGNSILPIIADRTGYYISDDIEYLEAQKKRLEKIISQLQFAHKGICDTISQIEQQNI